MPILTKLSEIKIHYHANVIVIKANVRKQYIISAKTLFTMIPVIHGGCIWEHVMEFLVIIMPSFTKLEDIFMSTESSITDFKIRDWIDLLLFNGHNKFDAKQNR